MNQIREVSEIEKEMEKLDKKNETGGGGGVCAGNDRGVVVCVGGGFDYQLKSNFINNIKKGKKS